MYYETFSLMNILAGEPTPIYRQWWQFWKPRIVGYFYSVSYTFNVTQE